MHVQLQNQRASQGLLPGRIIPALVHSLPLSGSQHSARSVPLSLLSTFILFSLSLSLLSSRLGVGRHKMQIIRCNYALLLGVRAPPVVATFLSAKYGDGEAKV
jgi:hypothetical protein